MRKLIKTTDELPQEFCLKNYEGMDRLSAFDWFFLFQARYLLTSLLENGIKHFAHPEKLTEDEENEAAQQAIEQLLTMPLQLDLAFNYKKHNGVVIELDISTSSYHDFMKDHYPVKELYEDDLKSLLSCAKNNQIVFNSSKGETILLGEDYEFKKLSTTYPIVINPFYPNHIIFKELENLLIKIRQKIKIKDSYKVISKKDLLNWASYKILPYMDLKIWELYNGVKITNSVMCSALYTKGEYGEDTLRKSVEPLRLRVLNQIFFATLENIDEISLFDSLAYLAYADLLENGKNS
ncbi:DUF6387 family protein [Acinetobacter sp.]|uniref:DUF6387 family protein n=1 Tax=Acinetobacter sp. TaxID=472 RepID=UPI003C770B9F